MKIQYALFACLSILLSLSGCSSKPVKTIEISTQDEPTQLLAQATQLREKGQWAQAIETLKQSVALYPESKLLKQTLDNLEKAWQLEKQTLYQRVLISETQSLLQQQNILETIAENSPSDLKAKTALLLNDMQLKGKIKELNECVEFQQKYSLKLASTCSRLVNQILQTEDSQNRYESINSTYQQALTQSRQIKKQRSEQQLLQAAEVQMEQGQYLEAHALLEEVLNSSPDNARAVKLIQELKLTLNQQADILFSVGDQLYRDGQLEQAVAVWKSLLKLTPDNTNVKARIERAEHVLNKLDSLRKEQAE